MIVRSDLAYDIATRLAARHGKSKTQVLLEALEAAQRKMDLQDAERRGSPPEVSTKSA